MLAARVRLSVFLCVSALAAVSCFQVIPKRHQPNQLFQDYVVRSSSSNGCVVSYRKSSCLARIGVSVDGEKMSMVQAETAVELDQKDLLMNMAKAREALDAVLDGEALKTNEPKRVPPPNSLAKVEFSDAGTLEIIAPSQGMSPGNWLAVAFSVALFSAIGPPTFVGAAPLASKMLLLPFWVAGGMVGSNAFVDPFVSSTLTIGQCAWSLESKYLGTAIQFVEGSITELGEAVPELVADHNGEARGLELRLYTENNGVLVFGSSLPEFEQEYLAEEINCHLKNLKKLKDAPGDLYLP